MAFWTTEKNEAVNPKLKSRFIVEIANQRLFNVKSVKKPTFTIDTKEYQLLNHKFKYPGIPNWEPVEITFVDSQMDEGPNSTEKVLYQMINDSGYLIPTITSHRIGNEITSISTPEKASMQSHSFLSSHLPLQSKNAAAITLGQNFGGSVDIIQLNPDGSVRDKWVLHGPIIKSISFGDLSYESDDLVEYVLSIEYDFAEYYSDGTRSQVITS